jgi:hypothetical protein
MEKGKGERNWGERSNKDREWKKWKGTAEKNKGKLYRKGGKQKKKKAGFEGKHMK